MRRDRQPNTKKADGRKAEKQKQHVMKMKRADLLDTHNPKEAALWVNVQTTAAVQKHV